MAFPGSAWKYVPSSGVPNPPRCVPPLSGGGFAPESASGAVCSHERAAALAEVGECGARLGCLFGGRRYACRRTTEGPVGVLVAFWPQRSLAAWVHRLPCTAMPARRTSTGGLSDRRRSTRLLALNSLHRMEQDYPLNLSISLSGGKETNRDAPSNGE